MTNAKKVQVRISGRAWNAEPWGSDPYAKCDSPDMQQVVDTAVVSRRGRGVSVLLEGPPEVLGWFAEDLENDGQAWIGQCDSSDLRAEAKACLVAAQRIRDAIKGAL